MSGFSRGVLAVLVLGLVLVGCQSDKAGFKIKETKSASTESSPAPDSGETGSTIGGLLPFAGLFASTDDGAAPVAKIPAPGSMTDILPSGAASIVGVRKVSLTNLTLAEAVGLAVSRHPDIGRAQAVVAQSAAEVSIAKAAWFPTLEYSVSPGYGSAFSGDGSNNKTGIRGSVGVNQLVYDFGRTASTIDAAGASLNRQRHTLAYTVENIAFDVSGYYVALAASQATAEAARTAVVALRKTREMIADRVKAGLSNASDLIQADVAIQRALADQVKAQTSIDVAAGRLAEVLGVRPQKVAGLMVTDRTVAELGAGRNDVENTPAVQAAREAVREADARVRIARSEYFPSVSVTAGKSMSNGEKSSYDNSWLGVSVGGNFSTGLSATHKVTAASAERDAADKQLENQRLSARTTVSSAEVESSGAKTRTQTYDTMKDLSRSSRDLYWQEYTLNKRPLTEVLNAERDIYLAEAERIAAISDGIMARIRAHVATGSFMNRLREREGKR